MIVVTWEWSFAVDANVPIGHENEHDYSYQVQIARQISRTDGGPPLAWFDYLDHGETAGLQFADELITDSATGDRELKLSGTLKQGQLLPEDMFHVRIRVRDADTEGPWATVGPVSPQPLTAPSAPTDFTAVPSPDDPQNKILFSWTAPPEAALDEVSYRLAIRGSETEDWRLVNEISATTYTLTLAWPFQFDVYELHAVRDYGDLGLADSEAVIALVTPSQPPTPTGVTASADSRLPASHVVIRWTAVPDEAGSEVNYELRSRESGSGESGWQEAVTGWLETAFRHGHRNPSTTYEYQVRASRRGNSETPVSDWSETATVTTDEEIGGL